MSANENILVIDDDEFTREVLRELLEPHYTVTLAGDGVEGVETARRVAPSLVLCDIRMPVMDGFGVVAALRENPSTADVPFIFLSAGSEPEIQRKGMNLGADDYMIKPVRRSEVIDTVEARLRRVRKIRGETGDLAPPAGAREQVAAQGVAREGTVLYVGIRGFDKLAQRMSAEEIGDVLAGWHRRAAQEIESQNGWVVRSSGESILVMFDDPRDRAGNTVRRSLLAAFSLFRAARELRGSLVRAFEDSLGDCFSIILGMHHGPVTLLRRSAGAGGAMDIGGDSVDIVDGLRKQAAELGWSLAVTHSTAAIAGDLIGSGRSELIPDGRAGARATIVEVVAAGPGASSLAGIGGQSDLDILIVENDVAGTRRPPERRLGAPRGEEVVPEARALRARGYSVTRYLGGGGMSRVYLARERRSGNLQVLKFMVPSGQDIGAHIRQFLHEYALISHIMHPQVAAIHDQWFADGVACIAMEYFPSGDLRKELRASPQGLSVETALRYVKQISTGLAAIHGAGIVHRDMKPDNVMVRFDGTIAISDFGIAQRLGAPSIDATGEITGTSYYVSPEQAQGLALTPASDIYSLGIMFFEMLTGRRPFAGASIEAILQQHMLAPIPFLPEHLARLQPALDRMTAKNPSGRFTSALAISAALDA